MIYSDYRIISAITLTELEKTTNVLFDKGYVPVGGLVIYKDVLVCLYHQAVAKCTFMINGTPA